MIFLQDSQSLSALFQLASTSTTVLRQQILLRRKPMIPGGWQAIRSPNESSLH